jgi:hypothetical protein
LHPNLDRANEAVYVWSRVNPRHNRLIRDKFMLATREAREEVDKESSRILLANRRNANRTGVDREILRMWGQKIEAVATKHYEILCHHWSLLGERKTGAFVRACSAILARTIERLGGSAAHNARMVHRRRGGVGQSLERSYKNSAEGIANRWQTRLDIEARELELAASVARANKSNAAAPPRPEHGRNSPVVTPLLDPFAIVRPGEIIVEGGPLSSEDTDPTTAAVEMLQKLGFGVEGQEWPSLPFGPVAPDVLRELKRAHRILTTKGFRVVGDPSNPLGDGRNWVLRFAPTSKLPKDADVSGLAERLLQSEGIKVAAEPVQDGPTFLVALWDSGRVHIEEAQNKRKAFVGPLLESRGWSILDWAKDSGVDFHTANDYVNGETKPFLSTRKKLADSLGINAKDLPR